MKYCKLQGQLWGPSDNEPEARHILKAMDEVGGVPTAHGLELKEYVGTDRSRILKCKFLDSFALICASHKGSDSVSVVCMEEVNLQGQSSG
jgi:hypothetical protein